MHMYASFIMRCLLGIAVALSVASYWVSISIFTQLTPLLIGSSLQLHGYFYIITGFDVIGFFILFLMPETKVSTCMPEWLSL